MCAAALVLLAARGLAADEHSLKSPVAAANAANPEQPAVLVVSAAVSANAASPVLPLPLAATPNVPPPAVLPAAPSAIVPVKRHSEAHKFLDMRNSLALSAVAASLTADALSTQKGLSHQGFYEMNPLARPFVQSRAGAAVYSAGSLGLVAAGMYLAHRTNHHKVERFLPLAIAGWEGVLSARNYHVIAANTK
jgi:hypothetical protein